MRGEHHDGYSATYGALMALRNDVFKYLYLTPAAIVLPGHGAITRLSGLPVIWDDRDNAEAGLVYVPPRDTPPVSH